MGTLRAVPKPLLVASGSLPSWNCMTISLSPAINLYFPVGWEALAKRQAQCHRRRNRNCSTRSDQIGNRPRNMEANRSRTIHMACAVLILATALQQTVSAIEILRVFSTRCGPIMKTPKLRPSPRLASLLTAIHGYTDLPADFRWDYCSMTSSSKVPGSTAPRFPAAAGPNFAATTYTL